MVFFGIFFINLKVSAIVFLFIILSYLIIFLIQKNKLLKNSANISNNNRLRQKAIAESLGNMRETIIFGSQKFFLKIFNKANYIIGMSIANNQFLATIPKHIIEALCFSVVMIFIFVLQTNGLLNEYLPMVAIYLVAAYKLLPAVQGIATSYASIKGNYTALVNILPEIKIILKTENENKKLETNFSKVNFLKIDIENFDFAHKEKQIFKNTNFALKKNQIIGISGETGVGKSSLIDIICGLMEPSSGAYKLNNIPITQDEKQKLIKIISLVPQRINLLDDTIKNNIVFSEKINDEDYDFEKLEKLKEICELNYIDNKFISWNTLVGENGSKLSGGQVQRIGIARALYKEPEILILDEATSALDDITEKKIINNLLKLTPKQTIIIISHKKEIFDNCDFVYEVKDLQLKIK